MLRSTSFVLCLALPAYAEQYECSGTDPQWTISLNESVAEFSFERTTEFTIPDTAIALGREWPRAMPLISDFDTAVVVLDQGICGDSNLRAHVLTQRGQTPILLTGCCEVTP